MIDIT